MDSNKSIDDNLDEFLKMTLMLTGTAHALNDTSTVMILMNSIPDTYQVVKDAFQYTGTVPSYDQFCTALRTREMELKGSQSKAGKGLFVKTKPGQFNSCKGKSHAINGSSENKPKTDQKKDAKYQGPPRKCYYCCKVGHFRRNYQKFLAKNKTQNNETNLADVKDQNTDSPEVLNVTDKLISDQWVLDSGCSFHMLKGQGSVTLEMSNGKMVTLTNVRHVPDLRRNLIYLGVLDDLGCSYTVKNGAMNVFKSYKLVLCGKKNGSLYYLDGYFPDKGVHEANIGDADKKSTIR
ncbi:unnamed protein product [Rhodiola kirilowii]